HRGTADPTVDAPLPSEQPINSLGVEYRVRANRNTALSFSGGGVKSFAGMEYTFSAGFNRRLGNFCAAATYLRGIALQSGSATGLTQGHNNNGFYEMILARFKGQPTRNTAITVDTTITRAVSNPFFESHKAAMAFARFDYRTSDRTVWFTSWESFHQSHNAFVLAPLSRNRFMTGIEISFSDETDRRTNYRNEDAQYVSLTDHALRRRALEED